MYLVHSNVFFSCAKDKFSKKRRLEEKKKTSARNWSKFACLTLKRIITSYSTQHWKLRARPRLNERTTYWRNTLEGQSLPLRVDSIRIIGEKISDPGSLGSTSVPSKESTNPIVVMIHHFLWCTTPGGPMNPRNPWSSVLILISTSLHEFCLRLYLVSQLLYRFLVVIDARMKLIYFCIWLVHLTEQQETQQKILKQLSTKLNYKKSLGSYYQKSIT